MAMECSPPPQKVSLKHDIDVNIPMEETDEAEKKKKKKKKKNRTPLLCKD